MINKYNIKNIEGILYYKDISIVDFKIQNMKLIYCKDLSNGNHHPWQLAMLGLNYEAFNTFFNDRVVRDHAQDIRDYLDYLGLRHYDFEEMIKKMNGWDALGLFWIKFNNIGAKCWNDILNQRYPIY